MLKELHKLFDDYTNAGDSAHFIAQMDKYGRIDAPKLIGMFILIFKKLEELEKRTETKK